MDTIDTSIHWLQRVADYLPWFGVAFASVFIMWFLVKVLFRVLDLIYQLRRKMVLLEVTHSAYADKSAEANQRFVSMLHSLRSSQSRWDKLLRRSAAFTQELPSLGSEGIRFVLRVPARDIPTFEQAFVSYAPAAQIKQVEDYLPNDLAGKRVKVTEFKLSGDFALPLLDQGNLEKHDSMAQITGALSEPLEGEIISYQLVVDPVRIKSAEILSNKLKKHPELVYSLGQNQIPLLKPILTFTNSFLFGILNLIGDMASSGVGRAYNQHKTQYSTQQQAPVSAETKELAARVSAKLDQPLFRVSIRMITITSGEQTDNQREKRMRTALGVFRTDRQSLEAKLNIPLPVIQKYRAFAFKHRLPPLFPQNACILSASELADLYHFPHNQTTNTDNLVKSLSKTLPAPLSLKGKPELDVVIGRNYHHGITTDIGLVAEERELHTYLIGATGGGKSTLMKYAIVQDIRNGKGVAVIDPHGDLSRDILKHIPEERINDVVYFNPADLKYPIGFNLLELPKGLDHDERLLEQSRKIDAIVSIFRKVFSDDDSGGHRIENVLRNSIETAMTIKDATLFTVLKLLRNRDYRKRIVAGLEDSDLKDFWREELGSAGEMQRVSMSKGVTMKIDRFRGSPTARRILEQSKSTIDFEDIINMSKILICNLAEGIIGEDTSAVFGTTVLAELKIAAERRAMIDDSERQPFYLYVDEFQNFATSSFVKMLSGSRKYKLFLTIAEQSTSQQEEQRMVESILANVSTIICFKTGSPADERLLVQRLAPDIEVGEIGHLPRYSFYAHMTGLFPQKPVSGMTVMLEGGSKEIAEKVIRVSQTNYGRKYVALKKNSAPRSDKQGKPDQSPDTKDQQRSADEDYPDDDLPMAGL